MGIVVRQSIKTVAITYFGVALGFINTLWLLPWILSEEQIGLTRTFINSAMLFATLASLGAANIPSKFFPYYNDTSKKHYGFLFFLLLLGSTGFVLFCVVFLSFKSTIFSIYINTAPLLLQYYYYLIPFAGIVLWWDILEMYTVVHQLSVVPSFLREVLVRALTTLGILFIFFHLISFHGFMNWVVISYGIVLLSMIVYLKFKNILFLKPDAAFIRTPHIKEILTFGGFIMMGNLSGTIIANIDGLMLSAYSGLKSTGIYTIAFYIAVLVEIPKRSLAQVLIPVVSEANKNNDLRKLSEVYKKSSINQLVIGGLLFIGIWCNIENIFRMIPHGEVYLQGKWVVFFIGLSKLIDMGTGVNSEIINTSKYYKVRVLFYCFLSLFGILGNFILIPLYQITGAAIASAISVFLFNTMYFVFVAVKFKMQPFSLSTVKVIVLGILIVAGSHYIPNLGSPLVDIMIRSLIIVGVFVELVVFLKISEDVNAVLFKAFDRIKRMVHAD